MEIIIAVNHHLSADKSYHTFLAAHVDANANDAELQLQYPTFFN